MNKNELITYEASSLWLAGLLPVEWCARYIEWKVRRKFANYQMMQQVKIILEGDGTREEKFVQFQELRRSK